MTKEQKFYNALQDVFIGAKIEGEGGFVNLMRIKSNYYRKIEELLKQDIDKALQKYPTFRDELFDKLYSFFSRYFTESGSIYFNSTPFHNNIYEKVYTDEKDVILFWKTQMLYYVKTDRIFRSLPVEFPSDRGVDAEGGRGVFKFYFDASKIESKKANEKRSLVFDLKEISEDATIVFNVSYSERGTKTKQDEILKAIKRKGIAITEEQLERAFRVFEKQSEVDFFINKNAKAFLQEQFKLWSYQYFWEGAKEWSADRVNQLQILKDIAFKIIDFISQFEDELVKIWNKPKFVKNSNYVITLDRIKDKKIIEKILNHKNIKEQIKEWQELGIVDEKFKAEDVFENSPSMKGWQSEGLTGYSNLPYDPALKQKARELRRAGNLSEVLLWNELKKKIFGLDFAHQQVIGNYIVDFHCPKLNLVIEIDGRSHDFKGEYDAKRDEFLKSLGLNVLHFQDTDVKRNLSGVIETIKNWIKENTPSASQPPLLLKGEFEHLPIDTKYFKDLELEILSQFEDLDNSLDGWLIKSENYQALNTILPKFREKVQTIYIDPPYNTENDEFIYKDKFKHSSWLSLLENRLSLARFLMSKDGVIFVSIDDHEQSKLTSLLMEIFGEENFVNQIIWQKKFSPQNDAKWLSDNHDFITCFAKNKDLWKPSLLIRTEEQNARYQNPDNDPRGPWMSSGLDVKTYSAEYDYPIKTPSGRIVNPPKGRCWRCSKERFEELVKDNRIWFGPKKDNVPRIKRFLSEVKAGTTALTIWTYEEVGHNQEAAQELKNIGFVYSSPKPVRLLKKVIHIGSKSDSIILDFFAGSGTTAHAVMKLNYEDKSKRKFILVEMGDHFDTITLPRVKKITYSFNWKDGKPQDNDGAGIFFKYYELEQYEEALANCKYEDGDLFTVPGRSPYQEYVFMKDEKMLKALEIDYENNKVKVDLSKLYNTPSAHSPFQKGWQAKPDRVFADTPLQKGNIDIAETLSNLTGKWIKKINEDEVEFEDGTKINTKDLDYKLIKPLIWW